MNRVSLTIFRVVMSWDEWWWFTVCFGSCILEREGLKKLEKIILVGRPKMRRLEKTRSYIFIRVSHRHR